MKRKYVVSAIVLCIAMLGMSVYVMAAHQGTEEQAESGFSEENIIRNEKGEMVGVDVTNRPVGMEYRSIDLAQLRKREQFGEYEKLGLTYDEKEEKIYFAGMEVQMLEDNYTEGVALQYTSEKWWGEVGEYSPIALVAVRDENYRLKYFEFTKLLEIAETEDAELEGELEDGTSQKDEAEIGEWVIGGSLQDMKDGTVKGPAEDSSQDEIGEEEWPADEMVDSGSGMQEFYNRSVIAEEYAKKEFEGFLDLHNSECEILETSYGFYTSEIPTYVVKYRYSNGVKDDLTYAYKISVDEQGACRILEEGEDIADFIR